MRTIILLLILSLSAVTAPAQQSGPAGQDMRDGQPGQHMQGGQPPTPPQHAFQQCQGLQEGAVCQTPHGQGSCRSFGDQGLACLPDNRPGSMPGAGQDGQQGRQIGRQQGGQVGGQVGQGMGRASAGGRSSHGMDSMAKHRYPEKGEAGYALAKNPIATGGVPDTNQRHCFDDEGPVTCPKPGQAYYGQDAQYAGPKPSYTDNGDGAVTDNLTGLVWQKGHNAQRLPFFEARRACKNLRLGGRDDWRLPSIKELFSIIDFSGATGGDPFLPDAFDIAPPSEEFMRNDRQQTHFPEMMGQTWSATFYAGNLWDRDMDAAFFVNFLDGRIKCGDATGRGSLFYRCVAGRPWGANQFSDQGDGTVKDGLSGLVWQQADAGKPMDWPAALAACENLELAGKADWRLPNAKELQSIVDYTRVSPAIDTDYFSQTDPGGWFWSSTTHGEKVTDAAYVCFGKCVSAEGVDVHGAGAQRSDPKTMAQKREDSRGGQNDAIRVLNHVRCVRN